MSEYIADRLRCRYALGPIMTNGEPEFGWRDFSGPAIEGMTLPTPLMLEAAEAIAAKDAEIARLREAGSMTDDQIIALAREHGFLGAFDVVLDTEVALQFARLVIQEYEKKRGTAVC